MKNLFFILGIFICLGFSQGQWQLIEFDNQNVKCIAQHPTDKDIILISIADTIYRSNDSGNTWQPVVNFLGLPVNNITFHSVHYDTVFALVGAGSYSDALYRSPDTGNTWQFVNWFVYPLSMTISPFPYIILLGCNGFGIYKSENGGNTWQTMNIGLEDSSIYALDYSNPFDSLPIFFAGTGGGLFYWINNQWSQATGIATNVKVYSISYEKTGFTGFAAVDGGSFSDGIYKSTDLGQNWQLVESWIYASCVLLNPQNSTSIFAGDSGEGIKHSINGGTNWFYMNQGLDNLFINCLSIHQQDTLRFFAGTEGGLYRYFFTPGIEERESNLINNNRNEIVSSIVSANEPIIIQWCGSKKSLSDNIKLKIYDTSGRMIENREFAITSKIISISPLKKSGVYFLVISGNKSEYKNKLIVTR